MNAHQNLVAELHHVTRTAGPAIGYRLAHRLQHRSGAIGSLLVAPHHDAQRAGLCAKVATADRGVQEMHILFKELPRAPVGHAGRDGGMVYDQRTRPNRGNNANPRVQHHLQHVVGMRYAGQHHIALCSQLGRRLCNPGAHVPQPRGF